MEAMCRVSENYAYRIGGRLLCSRCAEGSERYGAAERAKGRMNPPAYDAVVPLRGWTCAECGEPLKRNG